MPLVSMKEMLIKARAQHYAVGQFNINNLEWTLAILDEVEAIQAPVILGVSSGAAKYMGGYKVIAAMVKAIIEERKITVPVALHLDHGESFDLCKTAIDAGFTSVMIDASHHSLEENIAMTKRVVEYAHQRDVSVEAELGRVGGQEDHVVAETMYAVPEECAKLVKETGIDCLAPALGSVHGPYKGEPKLGFDEMATINNLIKLPLVLHGGSGIPDYQLKMAIDRGTAKVNVNTELQQGWTATTRAILKKDENVYDPRKIIGPGKEAIRAVVKAKCEVFGCIGKAK